MSMVLQLRLVPGWGHRVRKQRRTFLYLTWSRSVGVSALRRHHRLSSDAPVFQPSPTELFRSPLNSPRAVEHSAPAERHVGAVTDRFCGERLETPSSQSLHPQSRAVAILRVNVDRLMRVTTERKTEKNWRSFVDNCKNHTLACYSYIVFIVRTNFVNEVSSIW